MSEWISAEDRLPEFDEVVLVSWPSFSDGCPVYAFGMRLDAGDGWIWGTDNYPVRSDGEYCNFQADDCEPNYWRPIPSPPRSKDDKQVD